MTNKNVGQGYTFALLHNVSNAMGQYLECGNLIIFLCDIYWLNVRRGCTSKEKTIKKEAVKLGLSDFFLETECETKASFRVLRFHSDIARYE